MQTLAQTPPAPAIPPATFRKVLGQVPTSVAIISGQDADGPFGMVVGSFVSISLSPALVGVFIDHKSAALPRFEATKSMAINVLADEHADFCLRFAKDRDSRFQGDAWQIGPEQNPLLNDALAWMEGPIVQSLTLGDHQLLVVQTDRLDANPDLEANKALVFFRGAFSA